MKNILIIAIILIFVSCKREVTNMTGSNIDKKALFSIENKQGQDLLNPELLEAYTADDIWLYYDINGKSEKVQNPVPTVGVYTTYDTKGMLITRYANQKQYSLVIELNTKGLERNMSKYTNTYIYWPNQDIDTIKTLFHYDEGGIWYSELWLNGIELRQNAIQQFKNDTSNTKLFHFSIIK